jgi:plasmid stabilization system protein ParE
MIRRIIVRPLAVDDLVEAAAWYERQAEGLGEELIDETLRAIHRAAANPELFRILRREGEIRRILTERFPYRVFFSISGDTLYAHAILHGAQHDRRWKTPLVSLPLFVQGPLPERSADQEHGVLGSRRVDVSRMVSARERVNQSSPREWSRWEASDMDGQTREGERSGTNANQAVRHGQAKRG